MMRHISIILIGALFGAGLALSGMLNPSKVAGFLDLFGTWDPSLAFVMGGGVVANFIGHRIVMRRPGPVFASGAAGFRIPANNAIDSKLVVGSASRATSSPSADVLTWLAPPPASLRMCRLKEPWSADGTGSPA